MVLRVLGSRRSQGWGAASANPAAALRALRVPELLAARREMAAWMRGRDSSRCLLLLAAVLMVESSQLGSSRAKLNSIKSSLGGETPAQAANRSAGIYQGLAFSGSKKGKSLGQVGRLPKSALQPGEVGRCAAARAGCLCDQERICLQVWHAPRRAREGPWSSDSGGCGRRAAGWAGQVLSHHTGRGGEAGGLALSHGTAAAGSASLNIGEVDCARQLLGGGYCPGCFTSSLG